MLLPRIIWQVFLIKDLDQFKLSASLPVGGAFFLLCGLMRIVRVETSSYARRSGVIDRDGKVKAIKGKIFDDFDILTEELKGKLVAPLDPPAIYCVGLNYRLHAEETGARIKKHPVVFMKAPSAVVGPGEPIQIPTVMASRKVDFECELAVVVGRKAKNLSLENALDCVLGYTCANDVSARDWQVEFGGGQWCRGKTFDTFCPLGPAIVTPDEVGDPQNLRISTIVNGQLMQTSSTGEMIFSVAELLVFLSGSTTLWPGTVVLTGTPHGVGMARNPPVWLRPGDNVVVEIERVGRLENPVIEEKQIY